MRVFNEKSSVTVTATPFDVDGIAYTPTTARYKVNDCRSGNELVAWTSLTPSTSMEITVPGSVNTIVNDRNAKETKVITVNTDNGLSTEHNEDYTYAIKNLRFVT